MRTILLRAFSFLILFFPGATAGISQEVSTGRPEEVKIGLALSGGGAKGFAHIGLLKVFEEENIPIHVVTGSSMGAIIGGLYSIGYTPAQLMEIAYSTDWQTLFNDHYKPSSRDLSTFVSTRDTWLLSFPVVENRPRLPTGLVDGQNLSMLLYRLMLPYQGVDDFSTLPVPFAAVATNLGTGQTRRFVNGYLPDVIRASAAIPSIFKPVPIGDSLYIDGGIARSIPAVDARAIGADIVLVSDVGEPVKPADSLDTFVDILFQAIGFHQIESDTVQIQLADVYIRPDIESFDSFSYDQISALIKTGEDAARRSLPAIRALLDSLNVAPVATRQEIRPNSDTPFRITGIRYENVENRLIRQARLALNIEPPEELTYAEIERRINRLYRIEHFSHISYRLLDDPGSSDGMILVLRFNYSEPDRIGFSMRYDSRYKASLLFGVDLWNELVQGDRFASELRLGEILGLSARYDIPVALNPASTVHLDADLYRSPVDLYEDEDRLSSVDVDMVEVTPSFSLQIFDQWSLSMGILGGFYSLDESVGTLLPSGESQFLLNGIAELMYGGLNRSYFPTRGQQLRVRAELSDKKVLSDRSYLQLFAEWKTAIPLFDGVELLTTLSAGHSSGGDLPLHYRFYLGGLTGNPAFGFRQAPLLGYRSQQLSGANLRSVYSAFQFHLGRNLFIRTAWNGAHLSESSGWDPGDLDIQHGFGISAGGLTLIGPVEFSVSTPDFRGSYLFQLDIGYQF